MLIIIMSEISDIHKIIYITISISILTITFSFWTIYSQS